MNAPQNTAPRTGVVVLNERAGNRQAKSLEARTELAFIETLQEPSTVISKYVRLDDHDVGDGGRDELHFLVGLLAENLHEVLAVPVLEKCVGLSFELICTDPVVAIRNLFQARDLQPLPLFERRYELTRLEQTVMRSSVEPCVAATHDLDAQLSLVEIARIHFGDLQFAPGAGSYACRDVAYL